MFYEEGFLLLKDTKIASIYSVVDQEIHYRVISNILCIKTQHRNEVTLIFMEQV
jgi:hypothetical protein